MNQRGLLFIAVGVAATLLLVMAAERLPWFSLPLSLLVPFPAVYVHMVGGVWPGGGIIVLCFGILAALGGMGEAGGYLLQFGVGSFVLPFLLKRKWAWDRAVATTVAVVMLGTFISLTGYALYHDQNMGHLVEEYVGGQLEQARQIAKGSNFTPEQREELTLVLEKAGEFIRDTYPALALVTTAGALLFMLLLLNSFPATAGDIHGCAFRAWSVTPWLIWVLIAGGFGLAFGTGLVKILALNILVVLLPIYFVQGLALVAFFFWKKKFAPWFRTLGYVLILTINPLPVLVTGLGVFDLWVDFRKPRIKKED
ncbi:MAG: YybS family protein [Deltaproteobacteria bacterium]|nr:YybS family protein [Deltaproteobacteria bacterium]